MSIWTTQATPEDLAALSEDSMVSHLGIEFLEVGEDYIKARMPVDHRTHQPHKILHGGASVALAETLGSIAANLCIDREIKIAMGMEINANHIRSVSDGWVYGVTKPVHLGASTHIWEIRISDENDKLICISRLTMAVLPKNR
ncbi:MAG: hotdog fold thioesterase [Calditrichales bacterium]|nr:MAG: hotdog fold thioesterase [Calditrichales bacterium]